MARSDAILERLLALHPKVIDLSLDRVERLLARLGHPEHALPPVIHIAGTNGKGSVIAYLKAVLEAGGRQVHSYVSPHLVRFHERIALAAPGGSVPIDEPALCALLEEAETANGGEPITYFEITTAAAYLAFARNPADYLLLEVGLGGRLDATNVIDQPALTVITAVSLDHQQFLGDTLSGIAAEKAGILKPGVPCIVAPQAEEALGAIRARADEIGAPLIVAGEDWQAFEQHGRMVYQDEAGLLDLPLPRLLGRHQIDNAGAAIAALRALGDSSIDEQAMEQGLQEATWPGRLERLGPGALTDRLPAGAELWIDGGHNGAAGAALAQTMAEFEERVPRPLLLVVGMLTSKTPEAFLAPFRGLAAHVVCIAIPGEENAYPPSDLKALAAAMGFDASSAETLADALEQCLDLAGGEAPRILITGSLYLIGNVLAENEQPAGRLRPAG